MEIIFQNALAFYKKGQSEEAAQLLRQVLEMNPAHADSLYFLGIIAMDKGAFDVALDYLDKAHLLTPQNPDYIFSLAVALQETGRLSEALSYFEQIAHLPEAQNSIGNIYRAQGDNLKAMAAFDRALQLDSNMMWAMVNKAVLLRDTGHDKEALALLEKATQTDAFFSGAWHQLGVQQQKTGDPDAALLSFEKALKLHPDEALYWNDYGRLLAVKGRDEEALAAFDKAVLANRFSKEAYFNKGLVLEKMNRSDEAEQAYRDAIRCDHNFANAYNNLGALLYKTGRVNEALETYRQVFIIDPKHLEACFNLAVVLEDLEEYEEAAGLYFNVLSQKAYPEQVHVRLASLLPKWFAKGKNEAKEAGRFAQGWVKHFPDHPLARHTLNAFTGQPDDDTLFSYVQTFYNAFADSYNDKMKELDCRVPSLIQSMLPAQTNLMILDLGCGTGACSSFLKPIAKKLIGVDASARMLEIARQTRDYDVLEQKDILDYLVHAKQKFDLIIAADVFCYMNKLDDIFKEVHQHLKTKGLFLFTVEAAPDKADYQITPFGRYLHHKGYIERLLSHLHFTWSIQEVDLRKEGTGRAKGYLVSAQK